MSQKRSQEREGSGTTRCYPALRWSEEPPDEPGWYWHRYVTSAAVSTPAPERIVKKGTLLCVKEDYRFVPLEEHDGGYGEWAGPIPGPPESAG